MGLKTWLLALLVATLARGQSDSFSNFDWENFGQFNEWPTYTSLIPYHGRLMTTTTSFPQMMSNQDFENIPEPFDEDHHSHFEGYEEEDDKSQYLEDTRFKKKKNFNITMERLGGFGGTGDTRGFGAYDYPKKDHRHEPRVATRFPDLMRLGSNRKQYHNPVFVRPMPPPV